MLVMIVVLFKDVQVILNIFDYYQIPIKKQYQPFQNSTELEPTWKLESQTPRNLKKKKRREKRRLLNTL